MANGQTVDSKDRAQLLEKLDHALRSELAAHAEPDEYDFALALASASMAELIMSREQNSERKQKMRRVLAEKLALIRELWPERAHHVKARADLDRLLEKADLDRDMRRTLLVDLEFSDPFLPYELKYDEDDHRDAMEYIASQLLGLPAGIVDEIAKTRKSAYRAHHKVNVTKLALFGIGGAALLAVGGWIAAPYIAAYLGAAAGLSGAAAVAHGMALLGGGALAAGGYGMAGGMALVVGVGGVAGGVAGGAGALLYQLGGRGLENELIKLQVTFKEVVLHGQTQVAKAREVIAGLDARQRELEAFLREQEKLNDEKSHRIKELRDMIDAVRRSRDWMEEERRAA